MAIDEESGILWKRKAGEMRPWKIDFLWKQADDMCDGNGFDGWGVSVLERCSYVVKRFQELASVVYGTTVV